MFSGASKAAVFYKFATSSDTGSVTFTPDPGASTTNRCSMALMEFSGVNLTTPFDQTATSVTSNGAGVAGLQPLTSSTSHVNGGAVGLVMAAASNTMGAACTYAISPYSLNSVQHFYNATVSLGIGYVNFADTTVTELSSATVVWTTSRPSLAAYLVLRPSTYQQTGQTIAGTEFVTDSTAPVTTDSQTGTSIISTNTIANSIIPSTEAQTGVTIISSKIDNISINSTTNSSQTGRTIFSTNTITDLTDPITDSSRIASTVSLSSNVLNQIISTSTNVLGSINYLFNVLNNIRNSNQITTGQPIISQAKVANNNSITDSIVQSIISAKINIKNNNISKTTLKIINVMSTGFVNVSKNKVKNIIILIPLTVTNTRKKMRQILITVNNQIGIVRSITKNILIATKNLVEHSQQLLTDNWSLPLEEDPIDFSIANESEEYVLPTDTTFDYSQDDVQNPTDFGIAEGS